MVESKIQSNELSFSAMLVIVGTLLLGPVGIQGFLFQPSETGSEH